MKQTYTKADVLSVHMGSIHVRMRIAASATAWAKNNIDEVLRKMSSAHRFRYKRRIMFGGTEVTQDHVKRYFSDLGIGTISSWRRTAIESVLPKITREFDNKRRKAMRAAHVPMEETIAAIIEITGR